LVFGNFGNFEFFGILAWKEFLCDDGAERCRKKDSREADETSNGQGRGGGR